MDKNFLRYSMFFFSPRAYQAFPTTLRFSKKPSPGRVNSPSQEFFLSPVNIEVSSSSHREVFCKKGLKNPQNSQQNTCIRVTFDRVLARSYLMTLCFIFPIHVNFPITSSCVLKATIHKKKVNCVTLLVKAFFFSRFHGIIHHVVFDYFFSFDHDMSFFHVSLYIIYQLFSQCHVLYMRFFLNIREKGF